MVWRPCQCTAMICSARPMLSVLLDASSAASAGSVNLHDEKGACSACSPFFASMKRVVVYCAKCALDVYLCLMRRLPITMEIGTTCLMALVGAFVSSPQFSAICEEWDIQAMAGMPHAMISIVPARVSLAYQVRLTSRLREVLRVRGPQEVHLQTILYPSSGPPARRCFTIMSRILCPLPSVCCPLSVVQSSKSPARVFCLTGPLALNALNALNILIALDAMPPGDRQSNADETL